MKEDFLLQSKKFEQKLAGCSNKCKQEEIKNKNLNIKHKESEDIIEKSEDHIKKV